MFLNMAQIRFSHKHKARSFHAFSLVLIVTLSILAIFLLDDHHSIRKRLYFGFGVASAYQVINVSSKYDLLSDVFGTDNNADGKQIYRSFYHKSLPAPGVILHVKGGIGNQLFEWACSYALARDRKWPLYLFYKVDPSKVRGYKPYERDFVLDKFQIPLDNLIDDTTKLLGNPRYIGDHELLEKSFLRWSNFDTDDIFLQLNGASYCQSIEYWVNYQKDIQKYFRLRPEFLNMTLLQSYIDRLRSTESVIVHVRRGDFTRVRGFDIPISYQRQAIRRMINILENERGIKDPVFFVFSDDIEYAEAKFKDFSTRFQFHYVSRDLKDKSTSVEEFYLMTLGKHLIIPNSTFSWWAAYLNRNKDRVVIASAPNPAFYELFGKPDEKWGQFNRELFGKLMHPKQWIVINPFSGEF